MSSELPYTGERFIPGCDGAGIHLEHLHRYQLAAGLCSGTVLDLGCGVGYGSRLIARVARRVVGLDLSPAAVDFARRTFGADNVEFVAGDARRLPFDDARFDWVICFELIEHLREAEQLLLEVSRVLAPAGQLLLSTPNRPVYSEATGYANPFHLRELDEGELRALLTPHFAELEMLGQRLVAASTAELLGAPGEEGRAGLEVLAPLPELAPSLTVGEAPTYLVALCRRQAGRGKWLRGSLLSGRLEAFMGELAAARRSAEAEIHEAYRGVVATYEHATAELERQVRSFDEQQRELTAALVKERQEIDRLREVGEQERREIDRLRVELVTSGEELREAVAIERANTTLVNAERERLAEELAWIRRSKMWRLWMAYQAGRRVVLAVASPARLAAGAYRRVRAPLPKARAIARSAASWVAGAMSALRRPLARAAGWLYLLAWTARAWLLARLPRGGRTARRLGREAAPRQLVPPLALDFRPRLLIVFPYAIYPPHHGGGARLYNLVRCLAASCDLHLLLFLQGEDDPAQREALSPWVKSVTFHRWLPRQEADFWGLEPPSAQLFAAVEVYELIQQIIQRERVDILQLEYTELGQYGLRPWPGVNVVLTEHDIAFRSSARRRRAGLHRRYELGRLYGYSFSDWMRQFRHEVRVATQADQVCFMSEVDRAYLARFLPDESRLRVVPNAVDLEHYHPPADPAARGRELLFLGNFEHVPNVDAFDYLMSEIWPLIRGAVPDAELLAVGARAGESVRRYDGSQGVSVVGDVPDARPYYQRCRGLLAPLRAGSGTRLKILEALACGTPVLTTRLGAEGIEEAGGEHLLTAETPADFAAKACRLLRDDELCARLGRAGRALVEQSFSWEHSAAAALDGYFSLLRERAARPDRWYPPQLLAQSDGEVDVSIVIPTLGGGAGLERCLTAIAGQQTRLGVEVICVDSGSPVDEIAGMERLGARVIRIDRTQFDHGLTRDLGAAAGRGRVIVFLNQDAVPCDEHWLEELVAPLFGAGRPVAVQGAILEVPQPDQRFYWHSCGDRFYFTRETSRWLRRYSGLGFSTVNAAIRRDAWERYPFGEARIMEDKKWQRLVVGAGHSIAVAPRAAVHHTHDYDLRSLSRRCQSEGFGWRLLGETYSLRDVAVDLVRPRVWAELARGLASGRVRSSAELLFPVLRPLLLYRGNRWSRGVKL